MSDKPIYVTQPYLPPLEEFIPYLEEIWASKILTNGGPMHQRLERALCEYLGVEHIALFNNGTIALLTALQALGITGEVITTPYSFVATAHSLLWNGIKPVFVDIDPRTLNLDPSKIEAAITPQTTAILPVHCYGNPCDVEAIQSIADQYNLRVIYDAAHAFGVQDAGGSILRHGDLSVLSFHATKVFNTFEGGAIVCPDAETKQRIDQLKNFGFVDEVTVVAAGINGKMSEVNAAFGLLQLKYIGKVIEARRKIFLGYQSKLGELHGLSMAKKEINSSGNFSYFPIIIDDKFPITRDALYDALRMEKVYARRYFYPLIPDLVTYREFQPKDEGALLNARRIASQVLCLPMHPELTAIDMAKVIEIIYKATL